MSAVDATTELPPPVLPEPFPVTLSVTVSSVEGVMFLSDLGAQQVALSILFPSHSLDIMSPLIAPGPSLNFNFSEKFDLTFHAISTINALLAMPLEFYLYVCTLDMKKQVAVARFVFPFDQLLFSQSVTQRLEGRVLPEGTAILSNDGLHANVECSWSAPIFPPEDAESALIAIVSVSGVFAIPLAMINCTTQPNNAATHIFTYSLFGEMPDNQMFLLEDGKFISSSPDGSDATVQFNGFQKFYIGPTELAKWKEAAENGANIKFYLRPDLNELLQPLGILIDQYSALFAAAEFPVSYFAKPGRSHFQQGLPLMRDFAYADHQQGSPLMSPTGFPPEPVPEAGNKKKTPARRVFPSTRSALSAKGKPSTATGKKPRALSAKDKKALSQIQNCLQFDSQTDYFQESTTQVRIEISLSRPLIPRPMTPASSKTPEEIVRPLPKLHDQRLADATEEFCRQLNVAIDKL
jgi:hypothetical protein